MSTNRSVAVTRMHLTDQLTLVLLPLAILASAWVVNIVIWALVPPDGRQTGGAASIYFFVAAAALYAVVRGLPFALGMGSTRRSFTLGTLLTGGVLGVGFGTLVFLLQVLERVTDGWGLQGHFFWFAWFEGTAWPVLWAFAVASLTAIFLLGALVGAVWARFRIAALWVGGPAAVIVLGVGAIVLTWQEKWTAFLGWFGDQSPLQATGWFVLVCAVAALGTWAVLRRVRAV